VTAAPGLAITIVFAFDQSDCDDSGGLGKPLFMDHRGQSRAVDRMLTILVVEDHADTAAVMSKLLAYSGHQIQTAADCATARRVAKHVTPDVLICDIGLPDGTGLELLRELKKTYPKLCAIAVTGRAMESDHDATIAAGFNAHLTKPVDFNTLQKTIDGVCGPKDVPKSIR
jgi:CheY-like chemotaxis protein